LARNKSLFRRFFCVVKTERRAPIFENLDTRIWTGSTVQTASAEAKAVFTPANGLTQL
jgi:hypothetical protein